MGITNRIKYIGIHVYACMRAQETTTDAKKHIDEREKKNG